MYWFRLYSIAWYCDGCSFFVANRAVEAHPAFSLVCIAPSNLQSMNCCLGIKWFSKLPPELQSRVPLAWWPKLSGCLMMEVKLPRLPIYNHTHAIHLPLYLAYSTKFFPHLQTQFEHLTNPYDSALHRCRPQLTRSPSRNSSTIVLTNPQLPGWTAATQRGQMPSSNTKTSC